MLQRCDDLSVSTVWDGRAVYPSCYARDFAAANGIEHVCESLEEMAELVDMALVLGVDWDFHLMRSEPFLRAGKMVYIASPAAGKAAHCDSLVEWEDKGARIMAGGPVRYSREICDMRARIADLGELVTVTANAPPDFFGRGIHAAEMLGAAAGARLAGVKFIGSRAETCMFLVDCNGGPICLLQLASPGNQLLLSVCGMSDEAAISLDGSDISGLADAIAQFARSGDPPTPLRKAIEPVRIVIAAGCARGHKDMVYIHDLDKCAGFDGWEYADEYAAAVRSSW